VIWLGFAALAAHYGYEILHGGHLWKTGDWLINFAGGPVRRGLIGSLLFGGASVTGVSLRWLTFSAQVAAYFAVFLFIQQLYLMRERPREWLLVLFSPAFIFFPLYDAAGGFRKEIVIFASLLILARSYARGTLNAATIAASVGLFALAAFSHEVAALSLPFFAYVLVAAWRSGMIDSRLAALSIALFCSTGLTSAVFALAYPGGDAVSARICESVVAMGFPADVCTGSIARLSNVEAQRQFNFVIRHWPNYLRVHAPLAVLALLPVLMSDWINRKTATLLLCGFVALLPLFMLGIDWGRWLHVFFVLTFIVLLADSVRRHVTIRHLPLWLLVAYVTTWSIPHSRSDQIGYGMIGNILKIAEAFREWYRYALWFSPVA
jgi:hypothetical protein